MPSRLSSETCSDQRPSARWGSSSEQHRGYRTRDPRSTPAQPSHHSREHGVPRHQQRRSSLRGSSPRPGQRGGEWSGRREAPGPRGLADWPGFLPSPIEPCVRFSRTRLADVLHRRHSACPVPRLEGTRRDDDSVEVDQPEVVRGLAGGCSAVTPRDESVGGSPKHQPGCAAVAPSLAVR
jgi:hypothetical protein